MKSRVWVLIISIFLLLCTSVFAQGVYSEYVPKNNEVIFNQSMFKIDVIELILTNTVQKLLLQVILLHL